MCIYYIYIMFTEFSQFFLPPKKEANATPLCQEAEDHPPCAPLAH